MRLIGGHGVDQSFDTVVMDQDAGMLGADETSLHHLPVEADQLVVETRDVEQADRLGVAHTVIMGDAVELKDMNSGNQREVDDVVGELR